MNLRLRSDGVSALHVLRTMPRIIPRFQLKNSNLIRNSYSSSSAPPPVYVRNPPSSSGGRTSAIVLFIIVLLAVVFFVCGVLHLVVRFVIKKRSSLSSSAPDSDQNDSGAFQRQLQHLFHLHDSGLDQAVIDALPVFLYKEIMGSKEPFDCAVCLCEFSEDDKLRLLPLCSHAFHIDCIDTWLLSNSTCPLCRGTLLAPGDQFENPDFNFRFFAGEDGVSGRAMGVGVSPGRKPAENEIISGKRVFSVRLGKFRSTNAEGETSGCLNSNLDDRRCFSMGSYQYIVAESDLVVALCPNGGVKGENSNCCAEGDSVEGKKINMRSKGESFSVSKIWQWSNKKSKFPNPSVSHLGSSSATASGTVVGLPFNGRRFQGP
ncbi:PREDICTED: RING-H2 finger protein ATL47-like [Tarenaya hassleriana]|uniref:RING-H2 finger protein ATL47-like n=1 Tax=Tarenaya hassleriana TaxID=28532 RepID=UPI00053C81A5|nr:PREDICTED: RING-H2 finger protein ATL47-like [Tarenaya hassleriana]